MQSNIQKTDISNMFKKNSKGEILLTGSGKFFRTQKQRYSKYSEPYKHLYKDQLCESLKNSSIEIRSRFLM
jgi:hypothetical protein